MAEGEKTRVRERASLDNNPYEINVRQRQERAERNRNGKVVVKPSDREVFMARQGKLQYLLNPNVYRDTPLQDWQVFKHEIRTRSGKHRHQGGVIIFVLEGYGYSIVDGERIDWKEGDLVLLPLKPEEVVHQHFNGDPDKPATWIAFRSVPITEHIAAETEQIENSPEYKG
jgi:hypothetical protein